MTVAKAPRGISLAMLLAVTAKDAVTDRRTPVRSTHPDWSTAAV